MIEKNEKNNISFRIDSNSSKMINWKIAGVTNLLLRFLFPFFPDIRYVYGCA